MSFRKTALVLGLAANLLLLLPELFRTGWRARGFREAWRRLLRTGTEAWGLAISALAASPRRRVALLRRLAGILPHARPVHRLLGNACFLAGYHADALAAFVRSMRLGDRSRQTAGTFQEAMKRARGVPGSRWEHILAELDLLHASTAASPTTVFLHGELLLHLQRFEEVLALARRFAPDRRFRVPALTLLGRACEELGRYGEAVQAFDTVCSLDLAWALEHSLHLRRAFLHGQQGRDEVARDAVEAHFLRNRSPDDPKNLLAYLARELLPRLERLYPSGRVGVCFSVPTGALGHTVLDPFHQWNLFRHRFDHFVLLHGHLEAYDAPCRLALQTLAQHVDLVDIGHHPLLNLAWQNLGELAHGRFSFLIHHYWGLNRLAYRQRSRGLHPIAAGRNYLRLPPKTTARAEELCRRHGFDLQRPLVVVHAREHGYHGLRSQAYRNMTAANYLPALARLVEEGYQVVRVGDRRMRPLGDLPGLVELPFLSWYDPVLDPFLIARCEFFIGCQSGPCSWARVLGKPNLVLNAVYHYTLIPEIQELVAFKNYLDAATGRILSAEEILRRGGCWLERTEQFEAAGIRLEEMTPEEILLAVEEMLAWLKEPGAPEGPPQTFFRNLLARSAVLDHPLRSPPMDYIGYALPECRLSEMVAARRPGFLAPVSRSPALVGATADLVEVPT